MCETVNGSEWLLWMTELQYLLRAQCIILLYFHKKFQFDMSFLHYDGCWSFLKSERVWEIMIKKWRFMKQGMIKEENEGRIYFTTLHFTRVLTPLTASNCSDDDDDVTTTAKDTSTMPTSKHSYTSGVLGKKYMLRWYNPFLSVAVLWVGRRNGITMWKSAVKIFYML